MFLARETENAWERKFIWNHTNRMTHTAYMKSKLKNLTENSFMTIVDIINRFHELNVIVSSLYDKGLILGNSPV